MSSGCLSSPRTRSSRKSQSKRGFEELFFFFFFLSCLFSQSIRVIVPRLEKREIELGIGSRLLQKMGWQPGSGLGKDESGPIRPIVVEQRAKDIGLGFSEQRKEKKEKKNKKNVPPPPLEVTCEECGEVVVGRKLIKVRSKKDERKILMLCLGAQSDASQKQTSENRRERRQ